MWTLDLNIIMSKAAWKKEICRCAVCRKCKDRVRKQAERAGTKEKYVARGRKADHEAKARREERLARKVELDRLAAEKAAERESHKARQRVFRHRRSEAFKRNVETKGIKMAKMMAVCIRKKQ